MPGAKSINMYDRVDIQAGGQFNSVIEISDPFEDFERAELIWTEFRALLMNYDVFRLKTNKVAYVELVSCVFAMFVLLFHV